MNDYKPIPFPAARYHTDGRSTTVDSPETDDALKKSESGWGDTPLPSTPPPPGSQPLPAGMKFTGTIDEATVPQPRNVAAPDPAAADENAAQRRVAHQEVVAEAAADERHEHELHEAIDEAAPGDVQKAAKKHKAK